MIALIYDLFILFALSWLVVVLVMLAAGFIFDYQFANDFSKVLPPHIVLPLLMISWFSYYIFFWYKSGQTPGMVAWRIKLTNTDLSLLNLKQCIHRSILGAIGLFIAGGGYWWKLLDKNKRSLADRLCDTQMVIVPTRDKG